MKEIKLRELLEAGCHFGHQVTRWNPKMKSYIFSARGKVHIFDLVKTKEGLEQAAEFVKSVVGRGGKILLVGTKKQAKEIVREKAKELEMPYATYRWVGGAITNWDLIKRNIDNLVQMKSKKAAGEYKEFTKKENLLIDRKITRLELIFGGLLGLEKLPEAIFVVDVRKELGAVKEARARGIKVVGIVDTNSDPTLVDYIIPANDDAVGSIKLIVEVIGEAVKEGKKQLKTGKVEVKIEEGEEVKEEKKEEEKKEKVKKAAKVSKKKAKKEKND